MNIKMLLIAAIITVSTGIILAQTTNKNRQSQKSCFVDNNKNGVCDRQDEKRFIKGSKLEFNNGSKRKKRNRSVHGKRINNGRYSVEKGKYFVDANNNGICDHKETGK